MRNYRIGNKRIRISLAECVEDLQALGESACGACRDKPHGFDKIVVKHTPRGFHRKRTRRITNISAGHNPARQHFLFAGDNCFGDLLRFFPAQPDHHGQKIHQPGVFR